MKPPPRPANAQSCGNDYEKLRVERDDLQKQLADLQKELNDKVEKLDYYWRKSKDMENKSTAFEVLLDHKSKDLALARQELEKKAGEPPPEDRKNYLTRIEHEEKLEQDTAYYKYHLEEISRREWDLQMGCLHYEETIQDLTSNLANATSSSKQKEEFSRKLIKLEKESSEAKESLRNLAEELKTEKEENHRRQALVVQAADQIVHRDNQIKLLKEENSQLEGKLQVFSEERSWFGHIMEGFRAKCGVEVGRGASAVQMFALLADFVSNQFTTLDQFCVQMQGRVFAGQEAQLPPLPPTVLSTMSSPKLDMDTSRKRGCSESEEEVPRKVVKTEVAKASGVIPGLDGYKPPVLKIEYEDSEEDFVVNIEN